MDKSILRQRVKENLDESVQQLNKALRGDGIEMLEPVLIRVSSGQGLPHWYPNLKATQTLPNLDGKSIGSIIEMLYLAILESHILKDVEQLSPLKINPAKGVDFPDLDLGVKSPSTNYCTSEPFFSAYERLLGSEYDCVVLLTNYQDVKDNSSLELQIQKIQYLNSTQLADKNLCQIAKNQREWLLNLGEAEAKKVFRFLAYINQSDWRAKNLLRLLGEELSRQDVSKDIEQIKLDYESKNSNRIASNKELISGYELSCFEKIQQVRPPYLGIIDAADNWIIDTYQDAARYPNENEWNRLKTSPLDGAIGMSLALQWRYNFRAVFS
ncbi:MAG: hypothetical protein GY797_34070 [Deltaproteobacteria bacterium]|nr:hypothetical protein [Deltaproteobacteria bacterium]